MNKYRITNEKDWLEVKFTSSITLPEVIELLDKYKLDNEPKNEGFNIEYEYLEEGCEKDEDGYYPWIFKPVFKPDSFELENVPDDLTFPVEIAIYDTNGDYAVLTLHCDFEDMHFKTCDDSDRNELVIDIDRITSLIEILKSIAKLER